MVGMWIMSKQTTYITKYIIQHPVPQPIPQHNPISTDRIHATNISMAQYREQRMLQSSEYRENPAKGHVGMLDR